MLWYIISSQLVTLGLLLHNAHIRQHTAAVYVAMVMVVSLYMYMLYTHELLIPCSISSVHNSLSYCCCPVTEPGVPYTVTVRASTTVGSGEPVSIIFFSVEQGKHLAVVCTRRIVM